MSKPVAPGLLDLSQDSHKLLVALNTMQNALIPFLKSKEVPPILKQIDAEIAYLRPLVHTLLSLGE